jgi:hypothetical protein
MNKLFVLAGFVFLTACGSDPISPVAPTEFLIVTSTQTVTCGDRKTEPVASRGGTTWLLRWCQAGASLHPTAMQYQAVSTPHENFWTMPEAESVAGCLGRNGGNLRCITDPTF